MRGVALVPTYKNFQTLPAVLEELTANKFSIIVVDDGNDEETVAWATAWSAACEGRWLIRFERNRGKGAAVAAGLAKARALGFDFAVTVDSDAQHRIEDALRLAANATLDAFILGAREERTPGYPARSLFGRRLWALGIRALTGIGVSDPICGLRCYPLRLIENIHCNAGRYAWEEEFLARACWRGIEVREVSISTVYQQGDARVSHFGVSDWLESVVVFVRLALLRVFLLVSTRMAEQKPLAARDRSWRRLAGMSVATSGLLACVAPVWIAAPILGWVAWRLHAMPILAFITLLSAAWMTESFPAWIVAGCACVGAYCVTTAARFLCKN